MEKLGVWGEAPQKITDLNDILQDETLWAYCVEFEIDSDKSFYTFRKISPGKVGIEKEKEILLESSWEHEIAKWLDQLGIIWIRPKPIKWFDTTTNRIRLYYPDFYLPEKNLYLDPKNPTALVLSLNKMNTVEKLIPLVYGSVEHIKEMVSNPELESGTHVPKTRMSPSTPVRVIYLKN